MVVCIHIWSTYKIAFWVLFSNFKGFDSWFSCQTFSGRNGVGEAGRHLPKELRSLRATAREAWIFSPGLKLKSCRLSSKLLILKVYEIWQSAITSFITNVFRITKHSVRKTTIFRCFTGADWWDAQQTCAWARETEGEGSSVVQIEMGYEHDRNVNCLALGNLGLELHISSWYLIEMSAILKGGPFFFGFFFV